MEDDPLAEIRRQELEELDALLDSTPDRTGTAHKQSVDAKRNKLAPANKNAFKPATNFVNPHKPEASAPPVPPRDNRAAKAESAASKTDPPVSPRKTGGAATPAAATPAPAQPAKADTKANIHMDDAVVRLEKLKVIYEKGLLDKDEYESRRKVLLDELLAPPH